MILRCKNKMTMAFAKLLQQAQQLDGMPEFIDLTPLEGVDLIRELHKLSDNKDILGKYTIETVDGQHDLTLILRGSKEPDWDTIKGAVNRWYKNGIKISFKDVELRIVPEKKQVDKTEEKPDNTTNG